MDWKESKLFALLRSLCEQFVGELENKLTGTQKNQKRRLQNERNSLWSPVFGNYWDCMLLLTYSTINFSCWWCATVAMVGEVAGWVGSWLGLFVLINHIINISHVCILRYIINTETNSNCSTLSTKEITNASEKTDQNKGIKHANRSAETSNAQFPKGFVRCVQDLRVPFEEEKMAIGQLPKFFSLCITYLIL